jgi:hypothetical protein
LEPKRFAGLLLAFAVLALGAALLWPYVTDDTWIHLRYAQNLLERGEYAFNPGDPTYGSTSPLWVFSLVFLLKLGLAPLAAARVLGLIVGAAKLVVADRLLVRFSMPSGWRPWLLLLIALDAWFLRWTLSGMETPLAELLMLVLLGPVAASGPIAWLAWGVTWGLGSLARPEIALLAPCALPWLLWLQRRRHPERSAFTSLAKVALGWLMVVGPWLVYAQSVFGRMIPGTAAAKSYPLQLTPSEVIDYLTRTIQQLAAVQGVLWVAFVVVAVGFWLDRRRGLAGGDGKTFGPRALALGAIAATWLVVLVGGYSVKQVWTISRYVSPLLAPLLLTMAALAGAMLRRQGSRGRFGRWVTGIAVVLALLINAGLLAVKVRPYATVFSRGVHDCYYVTGEWLRDSTPPDAVIAALDIGAIGYASERRILDLAGLVSPDARALGLEMGFEEMVASRRWLDLGTPDYFFDRTEGPPRWAGQTFNGVRFELLDTCGIDGVGLAEAGVWTYALYRLDRTPIR